MATAVSTLLNNQLNGLKGQLANEVKEQAIHGVSKATGVKEDKLNGVLNTAMSLSRGDILGTVQGLAGVLGAPEELQQVLGLLSNPMQAVGFAIDALGLEDTAVGDVFNAVGSVFGAWGSIMSVPGQVISDILHGDFSDIPDTIGDAFTGAWHMLEGGWDSLGEAWDKAEDFVGDAVEDVGHAVGDAAEWVGDRVEDVAHDVGHAVEDAAHDVGHAVEDAVEDVGHAVEDAWHHIF